MPPNAENTTNNTIRINMPTPDLFPLTKNITAEHIKARTKPDTAPYTIPFFLIGLTVINPHKKADKAADITPKNIYEEDENISVFNTAKEKTAIRTKNTTELIIDETETLFNNE